VLVRIAKLITSIPRLEPSATVQTTEMIEKHKQNHQDNFLINISSQLPPIMRSAFVSEKYVSNIYIYIYACVNHSVIYNYFLHVVTL
jgi:hypothetical protein